MGIRFRCHQCGHELHVKDFQGGKRGKCPACETRFRIPQTDADCSIPLTDDQRTAVARTGTALGNVAGARTSAGAALGNPGSLTDVQPPAVATTQVAKAPTAAPQVTKSPVPKALPVNEVPDATTSDGSGSLAPVSSSDSISTSPIAESSHAPVTSTLLQVGKPQAIVEASGATWYVRPASGGQFGPAPADIFEEWLNENRVTRDSFVWREGWPQWLLAADVFVDYYAAASAKPQANPNSASANPISKSAGLLLAGSPIANATSVPAIESLGERNRLARKLKRRRRYVMIISILATLAVILVVALVFVLFRNMP